jgi:hypothetical protein
MAQDADLQEIYCAWANEEYPGYAPIEEVKFVHEYEPDWSEVTPGAGDEIVVKVKRKNENKWAAVSWYSPEDSIELIHKVTTFGFNYKKE